MRGWKLTGLAAAMTAVAIWTGTATAGPLAPSLATDALGNFVDGVTIGGKSYIAGEGAAPNTQIGDTIDGVTIGGGAIIHVDWVVVHEGAFVYTYYYQLENSSVFDLNAFNIGAPTFPPVGFIPFTQGQMSGKDLDVVGDLAAGVGHTDSVFANLGDPSLPHPPFPATNETEKTGAGAALSGIQDASAVIISSLLVNFGVACTAPDTPAGCGKPSLLNVGEESSIIFAQGTRPHYGNWNTAGVGSQGTPVSWGSTAFNPVAGAEQGVMIPIPRVPQPSALMLLGTGLLGSAFWGIRRRKK